MDGHHKTQAGVAYAIWSKRQEYFKYGCVFYSSCACGLKLIHVYRYIGQYTAEVFWLNKYSSQCRSKTCQACSLQ